MTDSQNKEMTKNDETQDTLVEQVKEEIQDLEQLIGPGKRMDVTVKRRGKWFLFKGWVNSQQLKSRIFSRVPKIKGARWIIDRLPIRRVRKPVDLHDKS